MPDFTNFLFKHSLFASISKRFLPQTLLYRDELVKKSKDIQNEKEILAELHWIEMELTHTNEITKGLYENYVKGILTVQEYKELREGYQGKIDAHNQRMRELMHLLENSKQRTVWIRASIQILDELAVSKYLELTHVDRFIEKTIIFDGGKINFKLYISAIFVASSKINDFKGKF